jgi:hypothetical protein
MTWWEVVNVLGWAIVGACGGWATAGFIPLAGLMPEGDATMTQEQLSVAQHEAALERIVAKLLRAMFLHGMCLGGALATLCMLHAYNALALVIATEVVWIACRGWPWAV